MTFRSIDQIRAANRSQAREHFFDASSVRFFNSRVVSRVYPGGYFITSEAPDNESDRYTIRRAIYPSGKILTIGDFREFATHAEAAGHLDHLIRAVNEINS